MAKAKAEAKTEAKPAKEAKPEKVKEPKLIMGKYDPAKTRVKFGINKKTEKPYDGGENNPKSRKAGERFANYRNGITMAAAMEAGITAADIKWDLEHGFIEVQA